MGLLDNNTQIDYYQGGDLGNYQFVSLEDIINQFMVAYVGAEKTINRVSRTDVAFWAQRALAELSFDTFKSVKAQQIDLPPSLTMILPHDYVNYTQLSFVDSSGIKHPLYRTTDTSNPFEIRQEDDGSYEFQEQYELVVNNDFSATIGASPWQQSPNIVDNTSGLGTDITTPDGVATFGHSSHKLGGGTGFAISRALAMWQQIDVSDLDFINITATGTSSAASTVTVDSVSYAIPPSTLRFGVSTQVPTGNSVHDVLGGTSYGHSAFTSTDIFDISYLEWTGGESSTEEALLVNVIDNDVIYVIVTSFAPFAVNVTPEETLFTTNTIDNISVQNAYGNNMLVPAENADGNSSTWDLYKSVTPAENNNDNYEDDVYWPNQGERYGLDPQRAQVNGSFYIDERLGKINFSSNISGKTVILDYISDSLGTDSEMQVHKFAEEAMYKWITYGVLSTKLNIPEYIVQRVKKEKFAATRQAKLRLSNVKLKELTQVLKGKSKQIK